jgi:integrase
MPRKLTGRKEYRGGKVITRLRGKYLGSFDDDVEADAAIDAAIEVMAERAKAPMTLARFGKKWLKQRELDGVAGIRQERSRWAAHVLPADLAHMPLRSIRPRHVDAFAKALPARKAKRTIRRADRVELVDTDRPISRQTAQHALKLVYLALEAARIAGHLSGNPAAGIRVPRVRRPEPEGSRELVPYLTTDEIGRLLLALKPSPEWQSLYAVAIFGGLRKGEMLGLRWEDLELSGDRPRIRVRRTYDGPAKSASSRRDVPLLAQALAPLLRWQRHGGVRRLSGPVWPAPGGGMRRKGDPLRWPDKRYRAGNPPELRVTHGARHMSGCGEHMRFHDLRHTCASHLVMGSWTAAPLTLQQVQVWLGHSNISVTMRYAHLSPESIHGAAAEKTIDGETERS